MGGPPRADAQDRAGSGAVTPAARSADPGPAGGGRRGWGRTKLIDLMQIYLV